MSLPKKKSAFLLHFHFVPSIITHRHIVQPLSAVPVQISLPVLGRDAVERVRHVVAHILVPVLVQAERARCVLDEEVEQADLVVAQLGQLALDVVGDEVGALGIGREVDGLLEPRHRCWWWWLCCCF